MATVRSLVLALLATGLISVGATAAEPELFATLEVQGYGYTVQVLVNGADAGIEGGKSEGKRLMNAGHPMLAQAPPPIRAKHGLLKPGLNEFTIKYTKTDPQAAFPLAITLHAEGYSDPVFKLTASKKPSDTLTVKVRIEPTPPAGFKTIVIGDGM